MNYYNILCINVHAHGTPVKMLVLKFVMVIEMKKHCRVSGTVHNKINISLLTKQRINNLTQTLSHSDTDESMHCGILTCVTTGRYLIQESPSVAEKPARRLRKVCTVYVRAVGLYKLYS